MATSTTNATQNGNGHGAATVQLRDIPLSKIVVTEGFNPRGEVVEDAELQAMAATMRERGCLQPIRVRATETGDFALIAGERRYRAAALAELTALPAVVLTAGTGDEGEYQDLLTDAMIENELRSDLDPLQRARGYQAMIDSGLGVREVAERLGGRTKRSSREKRIKEHLAILSLPEQLRTLIAEQVIPLFGVKTLVALAEIHEEFAHAALRAVTPDDDSEPYAWQELIENPIDIAMNYMDELPGGVYSSRSSYPVDQFTLSEKAQKDLAAYTKLTGGGQITHVRFSAELVEQARLLGATHEASWFSIILGDDVASRLAEDYIAAVVKEARARQCRDRNTQGTSAVGSASVSGDSSVDGAAAGEPASAADRAQREADEAKAKRAEQQQRREDATKFNLELGLLVFKHLPKLKVDERVLRILASVDLGGSLGKIAMRGARLAMPTWVEQVQQKSGKTKTVYLDTSDAERRAKTFLEGAESAGDIAGRAFTLIALAALTDEDAVAQSNRSFYTLAFAGPWATRAARDLNAIVRERIKEGQCPELDELLAERVANDERQAEREAEAEQARARVHDASARISELSEEDLEALLADAETAWDQYSLKRYEVERAVTAERGRRENASGEVEPAGERELAEPAV
jgi:ParB/RepB/Spo0J family partition protein